MKKTKDEREEELAINHLIRTFYKKQKFEINRNPKHLTGGVLVRFPNGGPSKLKKLLLSWAAIEEIRNKLSGV